MLHDGDWEKEEDHKSLGSALAVPEPLVSHSLSSHQVGAFATTCVAFKFLGGSFNPQHGIYSSSSSRRVWKLDELACGKHGAQIPQTLKKKKKKHWLLLQVRRQVVVGAHNKHMQKHILDKEWMTLWLCLKRTSLPQIHIKDKFMA